MPSFKCVGIGPVVMRPSYNVLRVTVSDENTRTYVLKIGIKVCL